VSDVFTKAAELDAPVAEGLKATLIALADAKRAMGIRYSDWLLGAPSLETGIAASSMTQDEWGHSRLLYAMLKEFDLAPVSVEHDRSNEEYASVAALDEPFQDWAAFVAAVTVVDEALTVLLQGLAEGTWGPARNRIPKMVAEEKFHSAMGQAWYRKLAHANDEARSRLVGATRSFLPSVLTMLDPGDEAAAAMAGAGVLPQGAELRSRFNEKVGSVLAEAGFEIAAEDADRAGWDSQRRRTAGALAEEAAERARGDKNRELFVE